jgi:hypothetical protein
VRRHLHGFRLGGDSGPITKEPYALFASVSIALTCYFTLPSLCCAQSKYEYGLERISSLFLRL